MSQYSSLTRFVPAARAIRTSAAIAFVTTCALGTAQATPPAGVIGAPVVARGVFADATDVKFKVTGRGQEVIHVDNSRDTLVQQIVIGPGGNFGWHSHPGPVVVVVKSGELTFYEGDDPSCTPRTYVAGQVFVDRGQGHVHFARNLSASKNLELWATYFDVPTGIVGAQRIDAPNPGYCPF
jgi:quercetin dioxygenase-like cupin family protein